MEKKVKSYADYIAALKRRTTVALVSFVAVLVIGVYFAFSLPATYRSTALISIEQQDVATDLVQTTGASYAAEQLDLLWQDVMWSESVTAIIAKYDLYPGMVKNDPTLRLATQELRSNTFLEPQSVQFVSPRNENVRSATIAFTLAFDHTDAATAQQVATDLTDLYLRQNVASRTNQTEQTVEFLRLDIEEAREDADRTADELARFKERHAGNLPQLLNFHLQSIERTEQQLDNLDRDIRDSRNRLFTVETELATTNPFGNSVDADGNPIMGTADRLAALQTERLRLLSIYTPEHSAVKQIEREIEILTGGAPATATPEVIQARLDAVLAELQEARQTLTEDHPDVVRLNRSADELRQQLARALSAASQQSEFADLASRDPVVQQLRQQVQTEKSYYQSLVRRRAELEDKLEELRSKVAAMPQIEREYEVLTQQNEVATERYNEAIERMDAARRAQTLEARGVGQSFTLLEPPFLPIRPYSPNRMALVLLVVMVALGGAIGLALVRDMLDETVKGSKELAQITGAPPLAVIPVLQTTADERRHLMAVIAKSTVFVGGVAAAVGIATTMAG
jgi:uncharacterized protein involved in exopolysaccharide biosynthesis